MYNFGILCLTSCIWNKSKSCISLLVNNKTVFYCAGGSNHQGQRILLQYTWAYHTMTLKPERTSCQAMHQSMTSRKSTLGWRGFLGYYVYHKQQEHTTVCMTIKSGESLERSKWENFWKSLGLAVHLGHHFSVLRYNTSSDISVINNQKLVSCSSLTQIKRIIYHFRVIFFILIHYIVFQM